MNYLMPKFPFFLVFMYILYLVLSEVRKLEVRLTQLFHSYVLEDLRDVYKETGNIA